MDNEDENRQVTIETYLAPEGFGLRISGPRINREALIDDPVTYSANLAFLIEEYGRFGEVRVVSADPPVPDWLIPERYRV